MGLAAREVEAKGRDLMKASQTSNASTSLLTLLDELRKGVNASEELLRSTKIGVSVNRIRQYPDKAVARAATELVSKWKSDVGNRKNARQSSGASTPRPGGVSVAGTNSVNQNGSASPAPGPSTQSLSSPKAAKGKAKLTVPIDKRNAKDDGIDWRITGNQTRDSCVKLMYDGLAFLSEHEPEHVLKVARAVELAAFNALQPENNPAYRDKIRSLFQNLKNRSNHALRNGVMSSSISPAHFVKMSHEELKSAERKAEDAKLMKENMDKAMVAQEEKSVSRQLRCGKCGQRKVSYNQAQTRSADEPMTTFCECLNCGNRWKFS